MAQIEIDFDVYKALTLRRHSESHSYNDVLRELLDLPQKSPPLVATNAGVGGDWITYGARFPEGTRFRARYKGQVYEAVVHSGLLHLNGKAFKSPSIAAMSITKYTINGWNFWECQLPGSATWQRISAYRRT